MATVIGVRFEHAGKVYYFDPEGVWPRPDTDVVVETVRGIEIGHVVTGAREVDDALITAPLKKVIRVATPEDLAKNERNAEREEEAYRICAEKIIKHKLDMKLVSVEYTFDDSKIVFYFTANGRVDFRELVKDLAGVFKTRIELRQIGVRDEAKMLGGIGSCGRPICCGQFLGDFQPVSIKMAKEQNLSLNPTKISGLCSRLMCCLKYEQDQYEEILKKVPKVGRDCMTPDGVGVITDINVIRETVRVRMRGADDNFENRDYPVDDVRKLTNEERAAEQEARAAFQEAYEARQEERRQRQEKREAEEAARQEKRDKKRLPHAKTVRNTSTEEFIAGMAGGNGVTPVEGKNDEAPAQLLAAEKGERSSKEPSSRPPKDRQRRRRSDRGNTQQPKNPPEAQSADEIIRPDSTDEILDT